jgi:hypothetical protein
MFDHPASSIADDTHSKQAFNLSRVAGGSFRSIDAEVTDRKSLQTPHLVERVSTAGSAVSAGAEKQNGERSEKVKRV